MKEFSKFYSDPNDLKQIPSFSFLPPSLLRKIANHLTREHFTEGTVLIHEGEIADKIYILEEGRVEITVSRDHEIIWLASVSTGGLIGELALLNPEAKRTATVTAAIPLQVLAIKVQDFRKILSEHTEAEKLFIQTEELLLTYNFLKLASPFQSLKTEHLKKMTGRLKKQRAATKEIIFKEGDVGDRCFLIWEGEIEIIQKDHTEEKSIALLGPGAFFGEAALLTETPRNATARATKETQLLALDRADFLEILSWNKLIAPTLFELLSLRDKPVRHSGIQVQSYQSPDGEEIKILKNPHKGNYYRLSGIGWFIWERLDGHHNLKDLSLEYLEKYGTFSPYIIAEIVGGLISAGFVASPIIKAEKYLPALPVTQQLLLKIKNILQWRVALRDVDPLITKVYILLRINYIYTKIGQFLMAAMTLSSLIFFIYNIPHILHISNYFANTFSLIFYTVISLLLIILAHDAGHAFTTKFFGREVLSIGIGWHWFGPILYVDTSDIWPLSPQKRIVVHLAGLYTNLSLAGSIAIMSWFFPILYGPVLLFCSLSYYIVIFNLIPILDSDGYYALNDIRELRRVKS